jgi:hypothetical protein
MCKEHVDEYGCTEEWCRDPEQQGGPEIHRLRSCAECHHKGYILTIVDRAPGDEIQRCDNCGIFSDDDKARLAFVTDLQFGETRAADIAVRLAGTDAASHRLDQMATAIGSAILGLPAPPKRGE